MASRHSQLGRRQRWWAAALGALMGQGGGDSRQGHSHSTSSRQGPAAAAGRAPTTSAARTADHVPSRLGAVPHLAQRLPRPPHAQRLEVLAQLLRRRRRWCGGQKWCDAASWAHPLGGALGTPGRAGAEPGYLPARAARAGGTSREHIEQRQPPACAKRRRPSSKPRRPSSRPCSVPWRRRGNRCSPRSAASPGQTWPWRAGSPPPAFSAAPAKQGQRRMRGVGGGRHGRSAKVC